MCDTEEAYARLKAADFLTNEAIQRLYHLQPTNIITNMYFDPALAWNVPSSDLGPKAASETEIRLEHNNIHRSSVYESPPFLLMRKPPALVQMNPARTTRLLAPIA